MLEVTEYTKDEPPIRRPNYFGRSMIILPRLSEYIIDDKLRDAALKFLDIYKEKIAQYPASVSKHHWWTGGWRDHVEQVINIAVDYAININRKVNHSLIGTGNYGVKEDQFLDRVIVGALLHDAEKLNRYTYKPRYPNKPSKGSIMTRNGLLYNVSGDWDFAPGYRNGNERHIAADLESIKMALECGFPMEDWLTNAIIFAAGGYSPFAKEMQPTFEGVVLHVADYTSASILFNQGVGA